MWIINNIIDSISITINTCGAIDGIQISFNSHHHNLIFLISVCFGSAFQVFQLTELFCQPFALSSQPSACERSTWLSYCSWHPEDSKSVQNSFNQHSYQCHLDRWPDSFSCCCSNSQSNPERQTQWTIEWFDACPFVYVQPLFNVCLDAYHFCQ